MGETDLTFQGENPDETILFVLRRHPWTLFHAGLVLVVLLVVLTVVLVRFQGSWVTSWTIFLLGPLSLYLAARSWFLWSSSIYVLTNERLIAVDQTGWFHRTVSELALTDILKISHQVEGASATMFNFGDVKIVASGATEADLVLRAVYDPYEVQQRIIRAKRGETDTKDQTEDEESLTPTAKNVNKD